MIIKSVQDCINSENPLSDENINFLLNYKEEDSLLDYKVTFRTDDEKEWLGITKDVMAFANTRGGFLVFGVKDATFEVVGLEDDVVNYFKDTDKVLQKINRYLEPGISLLRSKDFIWEEKKVVVVFTPSSNVVTHIVSKDGKFKHPSGKENTILHQGTFYVRRSAGNQLANSRVIDEVVNQRLDLYKETLLGKIAQVVEAPQESEIYIYTENPDQETDTKIRIVNSEDAIPVMGMSFTTTPKTPEQWISAWIAITSQNNKVRPLNENLWEWYEIRHDLQLSEEQRIGLAKFFIISDMPAFFWLQNCDANLIKEMLIDSIGSRVPGVVIGPVLDVAAFLGKGFYNSAVKRLGDYSQKVPKRLLEYPANGPHSLFNRDQVESKRSKLSNSQFQKTLDAELTSIASQITTKDIAPQNVHELVWNAKNYDCYLYAQNDKYLSKK